MKNRSDGPIPLPTAEMVTGGQLANLLNAAGMVVRVLEGAPHWSLDDDAPKGGALDGGTKMAAEASLCTILNRIDLIVQDDARWNTTERDTLEKRSREMVEQNIEFLKEQTKAAGSVLRPSFRFRPALMRVAGGWAACLGDISDPNTAIIGVGESPEAALVAFDQLFAGQTPAQMVEWARKHEKLIDTEYGEHESLDPRGTESTETTPSSGSPVEGDRRGDGKKRRFRRRGGRASGADSEETPGGS